MLTSSGGSEIVIEMLQSAGASPMVDGKVDLVGNEALKKSIETYKQLIEWYNKNDLDFSEVTSINLDEYKGLSPEDPQSYRYFMNTHLFDHVNIDKNRTFVPDGLATDPEKACAEYNANIITTCISNH